MTIIDRIKGFFARLWYRLTASKRLRREPTIVCRKFWTAYNIYVMDEDGRFKNQPANYLGNHVFLLRKGKLLKPVKRNAL